ncbi:MAG TPA: DoxX family protein [Mycobacteriales bacterium]|nr:DoxX family protein [Mycobacteriales bacterium]
MNHLDTVAVLLRVALGVVMLAHGWNHLLGPGGVEGTARWFGSMGLRPPKVHALASGLTELGAGSALLLGLLTSLQCGAVVGIMSVAFVTAHRTNGFFVFRPGQGYEYVAVLAVVASALAVLGPGGLSVDHALGIDDALDGGVGLALSAGLGLVSAAGLLAAFWRPQP